MKYFITLYILCSIPLVTFSQKYILNDSTYILFLDGEWNEISKKEQASYARLIHGVNTQREFYPVEDYYATGELLMMGFSRSKEYLVEEGQFSWYRKGKGRPYSTGFYKAKQRTGTWYEYYPNGQLKEELIYYTSRERDSLGIDKNLTRQIKNSWDSTGKIEVNNYNGQYIMRNDKYEVVGNGMIKNGYPEGTWITYDSTGRKKYEDSYKDGKFINGITYKGNDTLRYDTLETPPVFPGGEAGLAKFISRQIRYPIGAHLSRIQGTVVVTFTIDGEGRIISKKIQTSVHPYLDSEALNLFKRMPQWTPGRRRGQPVNIQLTLPIRFALP